jgi:CBS domain-containing membrane protein
MNDFFSRFRPQATGVSLAEKVRSGLAGGIAILVLGLVLHALPQGSYQLVMLGSIAASAVLLFAVPHSPLAQPWNLVGGHLISSLPGWWFGVWIHDPVLAGAAAVGAAIFLMYALHCLHPPGAATALTLVLASQQFHPMGELLALYIVAANALTFLILGLVINNLLPERRYPMPAATPAAPPKPGPFITLESADIAWALTQMDSTIDVSEEDLAIIYQRALQHAQTRIEQKQS